MINFHQQVQYFLKKEINELYLMHTIRGFAISTIAIFIPIFFLKNGYSLFEVGLQLFLHYALAIPICFFALKMASKKGVKHLMHFSVPILIAFFLMLYNIIYLMNFLGKYEYLLIITLFYVFSTSIYWMGFHIEFSKFSSSKKETKQVGLLNIFSTIASALGPLIGAIIVTASSFNVLFILVIVFLIVAMLPLAFSGEHKDKFEFKFKEMLKFEDKSQRFAFLGEGVKDMAGRVLWPILLYLLFTNLEDIGGIFAISNTVLVLFTWYMSGKITDKNRMYFMRIGTYIHSATLIARVLIKSFVTLVFVQGIGALSWTVVDLPFRTIVYKKAKHEGAAYVTFFREVYLNIGRAMSVIFLMIMLVFLSNQTSLVLSILIGAVFLILMNFIKE